MILPEVVAIGLHLDNRDRRIAQSHQNVGEIILIGRWLANASDQNRVNLVQSGKLDGPRQSPKKTHIVVDARFVRQPSDTERALSITGDMHVDAESLSLHRFLSPPSVYHRRREVSSVNSIPLALRVKWTAREVIDANRQESFKPEGGFEPNLFLAYRASPYAKLRSRADLPIISLFFDNVRVL